MSVTDVDWDENVLLFENIEIFSPPENNKQHFKINTFQLKNKKYLLAAW
jgi:hypothetical protein